jgi:hypothetical protein
MRVADRPLVLPGDEVRGFPCEEAVETVERQMAIDELDLGRKELRDDDHGRA